ncbi:MAG: hypothetical protein SF187_06745 [Deltaproteobacteria bacterium]|nr:hypothetical protein [Deltaproteobacteria bacterium]
MFNKQTRNVFLVVGLWGWAACKQEATPPPPAPVVAEPAPPDAEVPDTRPLGPIRIGDVGFDTPESALHDGLSDVYLVSNIGGDPFGKDDNGFISMLSPDGVVKQLKFIDGAAKDVTLNAPKGLAIAGDTLYVADIDTVRMFDRTTGKAKGEVKIKGATFLNDIAVMDETVFVSDSGLKPGFKPSGSDAIHMIKDGKAKPLLKNKSLAGPNGLVTHGDMLWVVNFGGKTLQMVGMDGKLSGAVEMPEGQLDGVVMLRDGSFLVTSWASSSIYHGKPGSNAAFEAVITDVPSPADIGYDGGRNRVIVPLFQKNVVEIHTLAL